MQQSLRSDGCVGGGRAARILGIVAIVLLAGSTAFGQFIVQPMKVEVGAFPGREMTKRLTIENLDENTVRSIDLRLVDVTQDPDGTWQEIEPDAVITSGPNGTKWVTVLDANNEELPLEISKLRSCLEWLELKQDVITLDPLRRKFVDLKVKIPAGKRGYFCAALIAQTELPPGDTGYSASILVQFLVPIIINVQGRPMPHEVKLTDVDLHFRPLDGMKPAASEVSLKIDNPGGTYSRILSYARIFGKQGDHYRRITDVEYLDTGIIPGVTLNLREEVDRPLAKGTYKVQGYLIVDGRRGNAFEKEIEYEGDPRIIRTAGDAALELDPGELALEARPDTTRSANVRVNNASADTVIIDVETLVPEGMAGKVMVDTNENRNVRGEELSCADWVEVSPRRFKLAGHKSRNIRVVARMPASAAARPNYYATVQLNAYFPDGSSAGKTKGYVYVQTRGLEGTPEISTDDERLSLAELTPTRFRVTAWFDNLGTTHVMPRCRGILTTYEQGLATSGMARQRFTMDSEILSRDGFARTGNMLPFERRSFTGVLDLSDISPGLYRLTVILEHDKGGLSVQAQRGLKVSNVGGQIEVTPVDIDGFGGKTRIEL